MQKTAYGGLIIRAGLRKSDRHAHWLPAQMLLVMRLLTFFLFVACLSAAASGTGQTVTISGKALSYEQVFAAVKKQTGFVMMYDQKLLSSKRTFSIAATNLPLSDLMNIILKDQSLKYEIAGKTIFLSKKLQVVSSYQPVILLQSITGRVLHSVNGAPLAGATIANIQTGQTTISAEDGLFSMQFAKGQELKVSYVGFQELFLRRQANGSIGLSPSSRGRGELSGDSTNLKIQMIPAESNLSEVVVNKGYYTETQRLSTGNVARVSAKDIASQPVGDPLAALQGRVPGLVVSQTSGVPGGMFRVQLRGRTAIERIVTNDEPLFVIDGVPVANNNGYMNQLTSALGQPSTSLGATNPGGLSPFSSLNTQDIESIEVLVDADATAIYGSRGANGVILITTRKGSAGKTHGEFNFYKGISKASATADWFNTQEYLAMRREAFANDQVTMTNNNSYDMLLWDTTRYTDFKKLFIGGTANITDVQAGLSGGNTFTRFRLNSSYRRETTVFPAEWGSTRGTVSLNLNHESADKKFQAAMTANYSASNADLPTTDLTLYMNRAPHLQLYHDDGSLAWNEGNIVRVDNPLAELLNVYNTETEYLSSNLQLQYKLGEFVTLRSSFGFNRTHTDEYRTMLAASRNPDLPATNRQNTAYFAANNFSSWIVEPQVDFKKKMGGGTLQMTAGGSIQRNSIDRSSITGYGYTNEVLMRSLIGTTRIQSEINNSQYRYAAAFGRVNYNLHDRYLFNFSARRDGSSRFGPGKQYANFGAIGAAWIFSDEDFMQNISGILNFGKLRVSVGTTGNDKISDYQYLDTYRDVNTLSNGYEDSTSLSPGKLFNPDYRWESTRKQEIGLDLGFWNDRLRLSLAWFRHLSSNQLIRYQLPWTAGFGNVLMNFPAKVSNSGLELVVGGAPVQTRDWQWDLSVNMTLPRNKVLEFPGLESSSYYASVVLEQPLNVIYTYRYLGVDPETGYYLLDDKNNDNRLSIREDAQIGGTTDARFYGGIQNSIRYRQLELSIFSEFRRQVGTNWLVNLSVPGLIGTNVPRIAANRWQQPGDIAEVRRYSQLVSVTLPQHLKTTLISPLSSGNHTDASFLRIKNISLSYTLSENWTGKVGLRKVRVYFLAQNPVVFTRFKGSDPETQNTRRLPPLRTFTAGVQFSL